MDTLEWENDFVEKGAALEHERWAKWQAYVHSKCVEHENGKGEWVCFPAEMMKHWNRQIDTPYADLSEQEKEADRKEARTYLPLITEQRERAREEERDSIKKAFFEEFKEAGELWFPYRASLVEITDEEIEEPVKGHWDSIIKAAAPTKE